MKLDVEWTDTDGDLWHWFTKKEEAEQASVTGYVLETTPHQIWRTVVKKAATLSAPAGATIEGRSGQA